MKCFGPWSLLLLTGLAACSSGTSGPNRAPVAIAGPDLELVVGQKATLDGSQSYDPDGDSLTEHRWSILAAPDDSTAILAAVSDPENITLTPDTPGVWLVQLVVNDGRLDSEPDVVRVYSLTRCENDIDCDDGNVCTDDTCDPVLDCQYANNTNTCDDLDACTMNDNCSGGACLGEPLDGDGDGYVSDACMGSDCDDSSYDVNPGVFEGPEGDAMCLDFIDNDCDGATDGDDVGCMPCEEDADCQDTDVCNGEETCVNFDCMEGTDLVCDDDEFCTSDSCDSQLGCQNDPVDNGTECGDNFCNGSSWSIHTCQEGACTGSREVQDCSIGGPCTTAATCNAVDGCVGVDPVADGTSCEGGAGRCCSGICQTGWSCCAGDDCDDGNGCTDNVCQDGTCTYPCTNADCMNLVVDTPGTAGSWTNFTIETCDPGLDVTRFVCESSRNHDGVFTTNDFETDFGDFTTNGNVSLEAAAQNPHSKVPGSQGVRLCGSDAGLTVWVDTRGHLGIGLKFSVANDSLDGNDQILQASYHDGFNWQNILLIGDGLEQPYRDYFFILPEEADDRNSFGIEFWIHGGGADENDCAYVDDIVVFDALTRDAIYDMIWETFSDNYGRFSESDPQSDDVDRDWYDNGWRVEITDNGNANLHTTDAIDTTTVDPANRLIAGWHWRDVGDLDNGDYVFLEYSIDNGNAWRQVTAIGHSYTPGYYAYHQAVLPCDAVGIDTLRLRFIGPDTAGNQNGEGTIIDNVRLTEWEPQWVDEFGSYAHSGNGVFSGSVYSDTTGKADIICRHGCGETVRWSNQASTSYQ